MEHFFFFNKVAFTSINYFANVFEMKNILTITIAYVYDDTSFRFRTCITGDITI